MSGRERRHRWVAALGVMGGLAGMAAGVVQLTFGREIPQWSGAKSAPVALGLLTVGLSALAGWAAIAQLRHTSVRARAGLALSMIGPALLCLSTVGGLWYLPAVLLATAGLLTVDDLRATGRMLSDDWYRVLLSAVGGCMILMAAGAPPLIMITGTLGGIVLMVVGWLRSLSRTALAVLIAVGTVPFAILAWSAVVPVVAVVVAGLVAIPLLRTPDRAVAGSAPTRRGAR